MGVAGSCGCRDKMSLSARQATQRDRHENRNILPEAGDQIPNNQTFAVIIYRQVDPQPDTGSFEAMFSRKGWTGIWRNGVFDYHHYHSGAREVLGIGRGLATLQIGGPHGQRAPATKGSNRPRILRS